MEYFAINFAGKVRREKLHNREYLVAPLTLIVPGVLNGSQGALLYPPNEVKKNVNAWNGVPLTLGHPTRNGQQLSGRDPSVLNETGIGYVFHAHAKKGKLQAEGWFDVEAVKKVDNRVYDALLNRRKIELSTGLFTDNHPASQGATYNGKPYNYIARNYRPDHLAILPDQVGACSINDGCGVNVNAAQEEQSAPAVKGKCECGKPEGECDCGKGQDAGGEATVKIANVKRDIWDKIGEMMGIVEPIENAYQKSMNDRQTELTAQILKRFDKGKKPGNLSSIYIVDMYDDYVVYSKDGKYYELGYTEKDGDCVLSKDAPQEVERKTTYESVDNCGGPGSGVPGPCPGGGKGDSAEKARPGSDPKAAKDHASRDTKEAYEKSEHKAELRVLGEALDLHGEAMTMGAKSALTKAEKAFQSGNKEMGRKYLNSSKRELERGIKSWSKDLVMVKSMTEILEGVKGLIGNALPNQPKSTATGKWKRMNAGTGKGDAHEAAQRGALYLDTDDHAKGAQAKAEADAGSNPASWVEDEGTWDRAKAAADKGEYDDDTYWAVVTHIYKQMGGAVKSETKNSSVGKRSRPARRKRAGAVSNTGVRKMAKLNREDVIDSLVSNCDCFDEEDRDTLNSFEDKKLKKLHDQLVDNAMYADDEEEEDPEEEEEMMEEEEAPKKKLFMSKNKKKYASNRRNDDIAQDILNNRKKPQTAEEWFATAPPEIQSAVRNAMTLEQQTKKGLLDQLTANVNDDQVKRVLNRLKDKSIEELQDLVALLPPARTISAPNFIGASVPYPNQTTNERAIDKDDEDTLPLPTINYEAEYQERAKNRKVAAAS